MKVKLKRKLHGVSFKTNWISNSINCQKWNWRIQKCQRRRL